MNWLREGVDRQHWMNERLQLELTGDLGLSTPTLQARHSIYAASERCSVIPSAWNMLVRRPLP